jgi:hypothetical protein
MNAVNASNKIMEGLFDDHYLKFMSRVHVNNQQNPCTLYYVATDESIDGEDEAICVGTHARCLSGCA